MENSISSNLYYKLRYFQKCYHFISLMIGTIDRKWGYFYTISNDRLQPLTPIN